MYYIFYFVFFLLCVCLFFFFFFFSSRRRHTRWTGDWSSDVCSSDLADRQWRARRRDHQGVGKRRPGGGGRPRRWRLRETVDGLGQQPGGASRPLPGGHRAGGLGPPTEIGRASCRERVEIVGGGGQVR